METRMKLIEGEVRGQVDLIQLLGKPELIQEPPDED
jgi:hypothetical protein